MTEYNIYLVQSKVPYIYLYTTLAESPKSALDGLDLEFLSRAAGITEAVGLRAIETEKDDRNRDELIFDYIIDSDDSSSTAGSN